jgi:hypothetical protein
MFHTKLLIFDRYMVSVGSTNSQIPRPWDAPVTDAPDSGLAPHGNVPVIIPTIRMWMMQVPVDPRSS